MLENAIRLDPRLNRAEGVDARGRRAGWVDWRASLNHPRSTAGMADGVPNCLAAKAYVSFVET